MRMKNKNFVNQAYLLLKQLENCTATGGRLTCPVCYYFLRENGHRPDCHLDNCIKSFDEYYKEVKDIDEQYLFVLNAIVSENE